MRHIRVIYRLFYFSIYTTRIVAEVYYRRVLLRSPMPAVMAVRQRWARRVLAGLGIQVETTGVPPDIPCLILANHRSYLDPILMLRDVYGYPVAKAELANWPVIGKGAKWAGILYVQRDRSASRVTILKAIADVILEQGFSVILFPEGTTSDVPGMLPFKKGAIRTATKWELPVVPVAICFDDERDYWVGDSTFLEHAWERYKDPKVMVRIHYGPVMRHTDSDMLETEVRNWIEARLIADKLQHQSGSPEHA